MLRCFTKCLVTFHSPAQNDLGNVRNWRPLTYPPPGGGGCGCPLSTFLGGQKRCFLLLLDFWSKRVEKGSATPDRIPNPPKSPKIAKIEIKFFPSPCIFCYFWNNDYFQRTCENEILQKIAKKSFPSLQSTLGGPKCVWEKFGWFLNKI